MKEISKFANGDDARIRTPIIFQDGSGTEVVHDWNHGYRTGGSLYRLVSLIRKSEAWL